MSLRITQVDAFTGKPFAGNPAAVCLLPAPRTEAWMQAVAAEMNLSETAYLVRREDGSFDLRWFTPAVGVDLCGHATLASAHALWERGIVKPREQARFHTRGGLLTAKQLQDGWIEMDFPSTPSTPAGPPEGLIEALAIRPLSIGRTKFDYLIEAESEAAVRALTPDFSRLAKVKTRGVIITSAASTPGFDFVSRFFAPAVGINEDPVTGSAHCCLAPFWASRLGRESMTGLQVSARTGIVKVRLDADRVHIIGQAVTVLDCELRDS